MRYLLKKRRQVASLDKTYSFLDVYDAVAGTRLYALRLEDDRSSRGVFVRSEFALSRDEKFLQIVTGEHVQGEHSYDTAIHLATSGVELVRDADGAQFAFSDDGRFIYLMYLTDLVDTAQHAAGETLILDGDTGARLERQRDSGALFQSGARAVTVEAEDVFEVPWALQPALRKRYDAIVSSAVAVTQRAMAAHKPAISNSIFYGATEFDPRNLVIWFAFRDDAALQMAIQNGLPDQIRAVTQRALVEAGYPGEFVRPSAIGFVSEKAVNDAGGPWIYFR